MIPTTTKTQKPVPNTSKPPKPSNSQPSAPPPQSQSQAQPPVAASKSVASKQRVQPAKLTGFCDIVSQAALKKGKAPTAKAKPIAKVTASKTIEVAKTKTKMKTTTTTTTTNNSISSTKLKSVDKCEEFREKKLAEMKQHKINVERRMQTSRNNIDGQMYWSQRADKLKRYPKHEALHPSWYTENIYSNNSVDLETDEFVRGDQYDPNCYENREMFHRKKMHMDTGYGYPKSRSCCFGSGYEERPKPMLMPKSSSFTGYGSRGISNIRSVYSTVEEEENLMDVQPQQQQQQNNHSMNRNNVNRSSLRKFYCWENDRQHHADKEELYTTNVPHIEDDGYIKNSEIYQIERDRSYYSKKPNVDMQDVHATTNANYIRNIWHNRHRSSSLYKVHNINEINGNYLEECGGGGGGGHRELDTHHPFEDEYLIIHQNNPNSNVYSARNSFDDPGSVSRRQSQSHSYHSNEVYTMDAYDEKFSYMNRDRNKNGLDRSMRYSVDSSHHQHHHHSHRSKSMLEVKPPNRFDDSSSSSTIDDLYDFNFDFANQIELNYRNNNRLEKNINADNYSKYRNVSENIDDTDNDINDDDFDNNSQSDGDNDINFNSLTSPSHRARYPSTDNDYPLANRNVHHHRDRFYDNCLSPTEFYPTGNNSSDNCNQNMLSPNGNTTATAAATTAAAAAATINKGHHHHINDMDLPDNNKIYNNNNNNDAMNGGNNTHVNGAISLINNIFSIYKPRKYSPVSSCRTAAANQKMGSITKCMNVPSTVRPLGAPYNDFLTSMKRPLTITSSCFTTQKRNWNVPSSASVDQAHFKIIPEKTGLKISPLYRFGYEDDSKLRLKCTARPLLFPL